MSIKVLVADDSITIQKVIGIIFGSDEYSLTVVDNGKAAVDKAREINPDILLIDALMPGMSGYEVSEMVRSTPSLAAKPILILTGSFEPFDEEKARKCGADDFIAKPFESQQIITKVKELLELGRTRTLSAQVPTPPPPTPEPVLEQAPEVSTPIAEIPAPFSAQQSEAAQPPAPADDIWGAFTPEAEPPFEVPAPPVAAAPSSAPAEPDVFAIVTEENDAQLQQPAAPAVTSPQHTGSQWIPVEENTFEFDEEVVAEPPRSVQAVSAPETSFGDISFDDDTAPQAPPVFSAVPEPQSATPAPAFADLTAPPRAAEASPAPAMVSAPETAPPAAIAPTAGLTEEQLRAAIIGASREVIERIVWEVVPDLAEVMIREAIRKIKEGA